MKIIEAMISEQNLIIKPSVISVAESVNAYSLKIAYDEEWELVDTKVVTFTAANGTSIAIPDNGEEAGVLIPWEVLQCPGKVSVGVVGYAGTELKLTTTGLYDRNTFVVLPAAFGLATALTPTPDIYQKLLQTINQFNEGLEETNGKIGNLADLETEAKDNLVAAINEVLNGGGGEGTVKSVNQVEPDSDGNVELSASDIGAATPSDVSSAVAGEATAREQADTLLQGGIDSNSDEIDAINGKIPNQASASNQLADKDFVNSSIGTNTAYYISDDGEPFSFLADLEAYSGTLTNNDYAFVVGTDAAGNTTYTRYKYNADTETWAEEYVLNNSSFTAAQWAAISSGITSGDVSKLNGIEAGAEVNAIETVSVNGVAQTPVNKNVDLTIGEGIKTLTTADYNWPTTNPNGVALWTLDNGLYNLPHEVKAYTSGLKTVTDPYDTIGSALILIAKRNNCNITIFADTRYGLYVNNYVTSPTSAAIDISLQSATASSETILAGRMVINNLTSTNAYAPLSAYQGKVLKDLIDGSAIGVTETLTVADTNWTALSSSDPYTYQATVLATTTIGANSTVELINDAPVDFATYGFAIGAVSGQNITFYSIGQPDASKTLTINVKG